MRKYLIVVLLAVGLLMLGCTTPASGPGNGTAAGTGTGGSGGTGSGSAGTSGGSGTGTGSGTGAGGNGSGSAGNGSAGTPDLAGLGYDALIGLGTPVECTYTETSSDSTTTLTLKFKGSKVRGDGTTVLIGQETVPTGFVLLEAEYYIKMPTAATSGPLAECEWLKVAANSSTQTTSTSNGVDVNPLDGLKSANAKYECRPGLFGDDAFAVTGKVCDLDAIMKSLMNATAGGQTYTWPNDDEGDGGASSGSSPCDSLSDSATRTECRANCDPITDVVEKAECVASYQQY